MSDDGDDAEDGESGEDDDGDAEERIYDIAVSGDRAIADDGRAREPVGSTVDVENATYTNTIGDYFAAGRRVPAVYNGLVLSVVSVGGLGIITFNSDYAFTVTNVIIHGVPYLALVFWYMRRVGPDEEVGETPVIGRLKQWNWISALVVMLATVWVLAYVEELVWHRLVWQERGWLFGPAVDVESGWTHWLAGSPRKAQRAWRKALKLAQKMSMAYEEGLIHYEIGRHLPVNQPEREKHLATAREIFDQLGAIYPQQALFE